MKFITNVDLNKNEIRNVVIHPLATPPSSPKLGQIYFNSSDKFLYRYDGSDWGPIGVVYSQGSSVGAVITGLSENGVVTTTRVIDLSLTNYNPVSGGVVTTGMTLEQAMKALDNSLKGKQGTISDLESIRSGAALGATSAQPYIVTITASSGSFVSDKTVSQIVSAAEAGKSVSAHLSSGNLELEFTYLGYVSFEGHHKAAFVCFPANKDNPPSQTYLLEISDFSGTNVVNMTQESLGNYRLSIQGIPYRDLSSDVTELLDLAETAVQPSDISDMASKTWVGQQGYVTDSDIPVTDVKINNVSILDGTVAKIVYETGLGSDSGNAATVTAIRNFVNSSIESVAAYYVTSNAQGNAFTTKAALDAGPWYYAGSTRTPTRNDYAIVIADETHSGQTARYSYTDNQWAFQYTFNMGFTQAQIDAINSGVSSAKIALYDAHILRTDNPHNVTKTQVGLGNVGNFKAVSTVANQGLTDTEKANARANIGAGSSGFSGDYDDLTDKPVITMNGSAIKSPTFYAPTSGGTSGQVLVSNGSSAPTWQAAQTIKKYTTTNPSLTSSGGAWTWSIDGSVHGIGNGTLSIDIYEVSSGAKVIADVAVNPSNYNVTITIVDANSSRTLSANTYRAVLIG